MKPMTDAEIREAIITLGKGIVTHANILLELQDRLSAYAQGGTDLATGNIVMLGYIEQLERRIRALEERHRIYTPSVN